MFRALALTAVMSGLVPGCIAPLPACLNGRDPAPQPPRPVPFDCTVLLHFPDATLGNWASGQYEPIADKSEAAWSLWLANCTPLPLVPIVKIDQAPNVPGQQPMISVQLSRPRWESLNPPNLFPQGPVGHWSAPFLGDRGVWARAYLVGQPVVS